VTHGDSPDSSQPPAGFGVARSRGGPGSSPPVRGAGLAGARGQLGEPVDPQLGGGRQPGQRADEPVVLGPDERGRQRPAGERLDEQTELRQRQVRAADRGGRGRPVQAGRGQQLQLLDRDQRGAVDLGGGREQHLVGDPARLVEQGHPVIG
jgi:hypothetical protein